jgi:hypothetical protein
MNVLDLTEFSDHCPIDFTLLCDKCLSTNQGHSFIKIDWKQNNVDFLNHTLEDKRLVFDEITNKLLSDRDTIDNCVDALSNIIFDISFQLNGKTVHTGSKQGKINRVKKSLWFNEDCRLNKNEIYDCKIIYKRYPCDANKIKFLDSRNKYCRVKRETKRTFFNKEKHTLAKLSKNNPKHFWRYINKYKKKNVSNSNGIDMDQFLNHFKQSSNTAHSSTFNPNDTYDLNLLPSIETLDCAFTVEEVRTTISNMKRNKSCDLLGNVADFFIDSNDFISPYLTKIFNYIFDRGIYPDSWCKGAIIPIFKKGDKKEPSNYRGITLVNIISKIFSLCLRNRINCWCEGENMFNPSQFGFRDKRSTSDCIFILHSIIQNVLLQKHKLYCAFIDYEKAFDTVIHEALWIKLIESGLSCKIITMIKSIYANVKSCIKNTQDMSYSDFFDVSLGVKQGEPLSPLLFILFINDIKDCINVQNLSNADLHLLSVFMLIFADDIVLFTTNPVSLQNQLNNLYLYSSKWGLKININKTKICIFEKRKCRCNYTWSINNENLEIVNSFVYLGIKFLYTGNMSNTVKILNEQALRAYHHLVSIFGRVKLDVKTKLALFDALVTPIILYGSEVWGIYDNPDIDKLHYKFCKNILCVKQSTSNYAVLSELGRFPLAVLCKLRALRYWMKVANNQNSLLYQVFMEQMNVLTNFNCTKNNLWCHALKSTLDNLGLGYTLYLSDFTCDISHMVNQRLKDQFVQEWSDTLASQSKMEMYLKFKKSFEYEKYLDCISNEKLRIQMSQFRLSSHYLEIEVGRYSRLSREERKCKLCNQNVCESEYHFLLCCPLYNDLRVKYNVRTPWPTISKYILMMSSTNVLKLKSIAKYLVEAFKLRCDTLNHLAVV